MSKEKVTEEDEPKLTFSAKDYIDDKLKGEVSLFHKYLFWVALLAIGVGGFFWKDWKSLESSAHQEIQERTDREFKAEKIQALIESKAKEYAANEVERIVKDQIQPIKQQLELMVQREAKISEINKLGLEVKIEGSCQAYDALVGLVDDTEVSETAKTTLDKIQSSYMSIMARSSSRVRNNDLLVDDLCRFYQCRDNDPMVELQWRLLSSTFGKDDQTSVTQMDIVIPFLLEKIKIANSAKFSFVSCQYLNRVVQDQIDKQYIAFGAFYELFLKIRPLKSYQEEIMTIIEKPADREPIHNEISKVSINEEQKTAIKGIINKAINDLGPK